MGKKKKSAALKISLCAAAAVAAGGVFWLAQANAAAARQAGPVQTVVLERTDLTRTLSVSGVIESAVAQNVFSTGNSPVSQILVSVGDRVEEGDVLAVLDSTRIDNDIRQAELNLMSAELSYAEESRANRHGVASARTSLDASRISLERQSQAAANAQRDLDEALAEMDAEFDPGPHERMIEDARTNLERRRADHEDALAALSEALHDFDDFAHMNAINDARVAMERRLAQLEDARAELERETGGGGDAALVLAVTEAERHVQRRRDDLRDAEDGLRRARAANFGYGGAPAVQSAEAGVQAAERALEDARAALDRARANLDSSREQAASAAGRAYDSAHFAHEDAARAYERANLDLARARERAAEAADAALSRAADSLADAERALERALRDKERAIADFLDMNDSRLQGARRAHEDSLAQMRAAANSVAGAENALAQASERPETAGLGVDIQRLNLERLNRQRDDIYVVATASGVIADVFATVGAPPSGILFVIVDADNLRVSANVREHSLHEVRIGQAGQVSTVATGERVFEAEVDFISPRAVSPPGSTSVEFEVRARLFAPDEDVRIGMNAFLNIVIETSENALVVPLTAVVPDGDGQFVHALVGGERVPLPVRTGLRTSTHVEIFGDGIAEGLEVLARPALS